MYPEIFEIPWIHVTIHSYGTLIVARVPARLVVGEADGRRETRRRRREGLQRLLHPALRGHLRRPARPRVRPLRRVHEPSDGVPRDLGGRARPLRRRRARGCSFSSGTCRAGRSSAASRSSTCSRARRRSRWSSAGSRRSSPATTTASRRRPHGASPPRRSRTTRTRSAASQRLDGGAGAALHPSQVYGSLLALALFLLLAVVHRRSKVTGRTAALFLILHSVGHGRARDLPRRRPAPGRAPLLHRRHRRVAPLDALGGQFLAIPVFFTGIALLLIRRPVRGEPPR